LKTYRSAIDCYRRWDKPKFTSKFK